MTSFADELKKLRKDQGLSLREAAKRSNISHPYFSQLENGQREIPKLPVIKQIAHGLDVPYYKLLKLAGYVHNESLQKELIEVTEKYKEEAPKSIDLLEIALFARYGTDFYYGEAKLTDEQKEFITNVIFGLSAALTDDEKPLTSNDMKDLDVLLDQFFNKKDIY